MAIERLESALAVAAAARRDFLITNDTQTDPALRCDRAELSPGCLLKHGDDVLVGGVIARYLCPSDTPPWFHSMVVEDGRFVFGAHDATQVVDRAPADPEEEPMPIFPEPEEP